MKKLESSAGYYLLERGVLKRAGELIKDMLSPERALIISGENVFPLYGEALVTSLENSKIKTDTMVFPSGEGTKCLENFEKILYRLSENNYSRSDAAVVLGGGVTGDLGGFAASCFKRGMKLVQIPSSLLAMVDSSVGGKTGINLPDAKNQIGSFYEPQLSLCDPDLLRTLPMREYKCGMAEVIKYAVLFDRGFFNELLNENPDTEQAIYSCVKYKLEIVSQDSRDFGSRQLLNFGHTIGHAAEAVSNYEIPHGEAVAAGMAIMTKAAAAEGICGIDVYEELLKLLGKYGLPITVPYSAEEVYNAILSDKKLSGDMINLIMPHEIGECDIVPTKLSELKKLLLSGGLK